MNSSYLKKNFISFSVFLLTIAPSFPASLADKILTNRVKIGPTINSPIEFLGKIYFLANTGTLFESNYDLSEVKDIFKTDLPTFSAMTESDGVLYFGEGLHEHNKTHLYAYDLKSKKLVFKFPTQGHIERPPVIHENIAYIGFGSFGIGALDLKTNKLLWQKKAIKNGKLHVDATPVIYNDMLCSVSIYDFKGVFCLNPKDGNEIFDLKMALSPKSEVGISSDILFGYATEANMSDLKFNTESNFFIANLKDRKMVKEVKLRGYNFFAPIVIPDNKVFVTLSTGDLITISLTNGDITYVGEFPEPFISNSFLVDGALCAIGIMGQELCYKPVKGGYALTLEKRYIESPIGQIKNKINKKYYVPSRIGYFLL